MKLPVGLSVRDAQKQLLRGRGAALLERWGWKSERREEGGAGPMVKEGTGLEKGRGMEGLGCESRIAKGVTATAITDNWWEAAYDATAAAVGGEKKEKEEEDGSRGKKTKKNKEKREKKRRKREEELNGGGRVADDNLADVVGNWTKWKGKCEGKLQRIQRMEREALMGLESEGGKRKEDLPHKGKSKNREEEKSQKKEKKKSYDTWNELRQNQQQQQVGALPTGAARASSSDNGLSSDFSNAWWYTSGFRRVGVLEGLNDDGVKKNKRKQFSEKDQEELFTSAHDTKTAGRKGLGRARKTVEAITSAFEGKKVRLDLDCHDKEEETKKINKRILRARLKEYGKKKHDNFSINMNDLLCSLRDRDGFSSLSEKKLRKKLGKLSEVIVSGNAIKVSM